MNAYLETSVGVITLLLLVAVGLDLRPPDFARVRQQPLMVAVGVLLPPLLLPALAVALVALFRPQPIVASGLLLLVCCPAGGISNIYSYLARGSTALSVTLTAVSCAAGMVTIPAVAFTLEHVWQRPMPLAPPASTLFVRVLLLLAAPIAAGMTARARWPVLAGRLRPVLHRVGFVLLAVLVVLLFAGAFGSMTIDVRPAVLLAVAFTVSAFVVGGVVALAFRADAPDTFTIAAEFATRNVAIATALALSLGGVPFAFFGAIYLVCEIPLLLLASLGFRRLVADRRAESLDTASAMPEP